MNQPDTTPETTWTVQVSDEFGRPVSIRITAHNGVIHAYSPAATSIQMSPSEVGPLRDVLANAQAAAIRQRGSW